MKVKMILCYLATFLEMLHIYSYTNLLYNNNQKIKDFKRRKAAKGSQCSRVENKKRDQEKNNNEESTKK